LRTVLKHIVGHTYKPLLVKYLSKTRVYQYKELSLAIPPQVFHPGFFSSTRLLLEEVTRLPLEGQRLLELGAGSGLIAIAAAKRKAVVTATDINPVAVEYLHRNSQENNVQLEIIRSDLFTAIPPQQFDIIAVNPPYYRKKAQTWYDHAWYCGENGEYFSNLFRQLREYIHPATIVLMVLCDGCDREMIGAAAVKNDFDLRLRLTRQSLLEKNFIYKIENIK
jgi:release factor glutamine methyltransferase